MVEGPKKKLASTLQLFRDLGQSTASLVASGRHQDEEEDPDYLKVGLSCTLVALVCLGSAMSACMSECVHANVPALLCTMPA